MFLHQNIRGLNNQTVEFSDSASANLLMHNNRRNWTNYKIPQN